MYEIVEGFLEAIRLIVTLDPPDVMAIAARSIVISLTATIIASLIAVPLGAAINFGTFPGRKSLINLIQTLYSLPTVIVGLLIFLLISRVGPFGFMRLLFTPDRDDHRADGAHPPDHDRPHDLRALGGSTR